MATLKDIANLAGVSQGTVSNVLNGRGNVSSKKIKLVEAAAAQLGYTVNERAKLLRKGHSNILALVLPNTRLRRYNDIHTCFKSAAERLGYSVSLYLTDDIPARELSLISKLRSDMVAGVAMISCITASNNPYVEAGFAASELLYLDRQNRKDASYLGFDYFEAGRALGQIAGKEEGKFALLTETPYYSNDKAFLEGFTSAFPVARQHRIRVFKIDRRQRQKDLIQLLNAEQNISSFFSSSFSLTKSVSAVSQTFFPDIRSTPIYTMAPLHTLPEGSYHKYELDFRLLGNNAAQQLIQQLENPEGESVVALLPAAGFRQWKPQPFEHRNVKTLNLLMLNGPEAIAVQNLSRIYTNSTGIKINVSVFSYDEIYEILSTTGGKTFDILRIDITFLSWFAQKLLIPLEELDPNIAQTLPQFLDGVSQRYSTVANTIYALPFSPSVQLLYYRKDLFESTVLRRLYQEKYKRDLQPPANFTEFNRIAEFFTKKKNPSSPVDYGTSLTLGSFGVAGSEFMARYLETHKNLYDEDGKVRLSGPEGILAMKQLIELKEMAPTHSNTWWTDTAEDFASGRLAMAILYSNYASDLIREGSNISELIGCTLVPGHNPILGGASLGISRCSQHPHAALNFIKWLCSETVSSASTLLGGVSPCKAAYQNYELVESYPWLDLAGKSFSIAEGRRQPPEDHSPFNERQFLNIIGLAVKNAYNGVQSPADALDWAQKEFDQSFSPEKEGWGTSE